MKIVINTVENNLNIGETGTYICKLHYYIIIVLQDKVQYSNHIHEQYVTVLGRLFPHIFPYFVEHTCYNKLESKSNKSKMCAMLK